MNGWYQVPSPLTNQVEERVELPSHGPLKDAALPSPKRLRAGRSEASPTRPSVSEPIEEKCVFFCPTVVDPGRGFIGPPI